MGTRMWPRVLVGASRDLEGMGVLGEALLDDPTGLVARPHGVVRGAGEKDGPVDALHGNPGLLGRALDDPLVDEAHVELALGDDTADDAEVG